MPNNVCLLPMSLIIESCTFIFHLKIAHIIIPEDSISFQILTSRVYKYGQITKNIKYKIQSYANAKHQYKINAIPKA